MRILALDSSGMAATAAIAEDDRLLAEFTINYKKTHSQTLLPMLAEAARMIELDLNTIDAVAVAGGPGSFTGLRIGCATAKGIGLALNKPLVHVPTLEGLAWNFWGSEEIICPMMDARREEVYCGIYTFENGKLRVLADQEALPVRTLAQRLNAMGKRVILLGDGSLVHEALLGSILTAPFLIAPPHLREQRASSVAACAMEYARAGKLETAAEHKPSYLRVSQAERERALREKAGRQTDGAGR